MVHQNLNVLSREFAFPKSGTAMESKTAPMGVMRLTADTRAMKRTCLHVSSSQFISVLF